MLYFLLVLLSLSYAYMEMRTTAHPAEPSRRPGAPYTREARTRSNVRSLEQKRAMLCGSSQNYDSYPFQLNFMGTFASPMEDAICFAVGQVVAPYLKAPRTVPIIMDVYLSTVLPSGVLATCGPEQLSNSNAACALLLYTTNSSYDGCNPLATSLRMNVNANINSFYFGVDGNTPSNRYDMVTVASHETLHGLGILTGCNCDGTSCSDARFPSPWDQQIANLAPTCDAWIGQANRFMDNEYYAVYSGQTNIYTDASTPGSTTSHWDITLHDHPIAPCANSYQPKCNSLMEPAIYSGEAVHRIGGNTFVALNTMGYPTVTCVEYTDCESCTIGGCEWCENVCGFRDMVGVTLDGVTWPTCSVANGWLDQESQCANKGATLSATTTSYAASLSNTALASSISNPNGIDCSLSIPRGSPSKNSFDDICAAGTLPSLFE